MGLGWDSDFYQKPVVVRVYKSNETKRMEHEIAELLMEYDERVRNRR